MQPNPPEPDTVPEIDALRQQFLSKHKEDLQKAALEYAGRAVNPDASLPDCPRDWARLRERVWTLLERKRVSLSQTGTNATWLPLLQTERDNFLTRIRDTFNRYRGRNFVTAESSWFREHVAGRRLLRQTLLDICDWIDGQNSGVSVVSCLVSLSNWTCCSSGVNLIDLQSFPILLADCSGSVSSVAADGTLITAS